TWGGLLGPGAVMTWPGMVVQMGLPGTRMARRRRPPPGARKSPIMLAANNSPPKGEANSGVAEGAMAVAGGIWGAWSGGTALGVLSAGASHGGGGHGQSQDRPPNSRWACAGGGVIVRTTTPASSLA